MQCSEFAPGARLARDQPLGVEERGGAIGALANGALEELWGAGGEKGVWPRRSRLWTRESGDPGPRREGAIGRKSGGAKSWNAL